ncbi:hypothetical protein CAXC1_180030 [Candidatus Xenohaliotis californiensis]|uniref:Uncharacterized protein n=1 Tax=Candidatus Xenohaliotis californiensis TaxID=84677 RepID=A0ABM9N7E6_9RICK|nr:hypothetical protein CAXC1_180030 [Candidatus Xenohaliotis californiensis]
MCVNVGLLRKAWMNLGVNWFFVYKEHTNIINLLIYWIVNVISIGSCPPKLHG